MTHSTTAHEGWASATATRDSRIVRWQREPPAAPTSAPSVQTATRPPARATIEVPLVVPRLPPPQERFELLQQFEGTVLAVEGGEFHARVRDLTEPGNPDETAWFSLEDVMDDDLPLVAPGAVFYWQLGYRILRGGTKERASGLRFRRLPVWTRHQIAEMKDRARSWDDLFGLHEPG